MASDARTAEVGTLASDHGSAVTASATLQTLVSFDGTNGTEPRGGLIADAAGNLYGTTTEGGRFDYGTVFEIAKTATGYSSTPTTLVSFNGTNGYYPGENLFMDANGDLIGTTGGVAGQGPGPAVRGTIFEIAKTRAGFAGKPTTLVHFRAHGGYFPDGTLTTDAKGDIFGTTQGGPAPRDVFGTVFEVGKTAQGYRARQMLLARFDQPNASTSQPSSNLVLDASGNVFGATRLGGPSGNGEIFELAKTRAGYSAKPTEISDVGGADFLTMDKAGDIFGTSRSGSSGYGSVFEITKTGTSYTTTTLATFNGTNGSDPRSLEFDASGNLYGTTYSGGAYGKGSVFELAKTATGYATTPTTVYSFNGANGAAPIGPLSFDAAGNIYGTTAQGGAANDGTVFEITPGGTAVGSAAAPCFAGGTCIRTQGGDVPVEMLAVGDLVATVSGDLRRVAWLGHRTVDCRRHQQPREVLPVRIAADAFGLGRPMRDLVVSPGHAICVDILGEVLIPAIALVDGADIVQLEVERVTYWHVELDSHDIVLAENLPTESYLEMGNRGFFAEGEVVALAAKPDAPVKSHADFCRPFHACGPVVEAVRAGLAARAAEVQPAKERRAS